MAIDQAGVGQRPQVLSRLQFRRVRRQEEQVDVVGDLQLEAGMPAGPIEDQHNLLGRTRPCLAGEFGQLHFKQADTDRGRQMEHGAPRGGMHEADQGAPGEPVLHPRHRPLADRRPDPPPERFQPDPMFVGRPQLDRGVRERGRDWAQDRS